MPSWFMVWVAASSVAAMQAEPVSTVPDTAASPAQFERRVVGYGGRVDFLFTDGRAFRGSSGFLGVSRAFGSRDQVDCSAVTLVETKGGNLICAYPVGSSEGSSDSAIWMSRYTARDGWSDPWCVAEVDGGPHHNPVLFRDPKRAIYLFFKVGRSPSTWRTYWCQSEDGGNTWGKAKELVPGDRGGRGPSKNEPIILGDGAWLAPASTERDDRGQGAWKAFVDRSEDAGVTWERGEDFVVDPATIPGAGVLQPALWESAPDQIHAFMRTSGGFVGRSDSTDGGRTWSPVAPTIIPTAVNSSIDVELLEDGRLLLLYNPARTDTSLRSPLRLAVSSDNGVTWRDIVVLENQQGDFFHPCIIATKSGVAIAYSWNRERVRVWQVPVRALDVP